MDFVIEIPMLLSLRLLTRICQVLAAQPICSSLSFVNSVTQAGEPSIALKTSSKPTLHTTSLGEIPFCTCCSGDDVVDSIAPNSPDSSHSNPQDSIGVGVCVSVELVGSSSLAPNPCSSVCPITVILTPFCDEFSSSMDGEF